MPSLTRSQAAEHLNRLYPGSHWLSEDFGLFKVVCKTGDRISTFDMWLPVLAPNVESIARYRLNVDDSTLISLQRAPVEPEVSNLAGRSRDLRTNEVCETGHR